MPTFSYAAYTQEGEEEAGIVEAVSEYAALHDLAVRGLTVYSISEGPRYRAPWYNREITLRKQEVSAEDVAKFSEFLAAMLDAGVPLTRAIALTQRTTADRKLGGVLERVRAKLENGTDFAAAIATETEVLPKLYVAFVSIGVKSNSLVESLQAASVHFRNVAQRKSSAATALLYPLILVFAGLLLFFLLVFLMVPNLTPIFASSGLPLPPVLATLDGFGVFLTKHWLLLTPASVAGVVGIIAVSQTAPGERLLRELAFKIPLYGRARRDAEFAQITGALAMLIEAKFPLLECLKETASIFVHNQYSDVLRLSLSEVENGARMGPAFSVSPHVPPVVVDAVNVGEETNKLGPLLRAASMQLQSQSRATFETCSKIATPLVTLLIGGGIGFLVYTLMGAILEINELAF